MPKSRSAKPARQTPHAPARRSPCPVACALDIFGDRWTLLIVRDLILHRNRFKDFTASPEGIPTNILSDRLTRLRRNAIIEQVPAADGTRRLAYRLTRKGTALRPILKAMRDWGLQWAEGAQALLSEQRRSESPRST